MRKEKKRGERPKFIIVLEVSLADFAKG